MMLSFSTIPLVKLKEIIFGTLAKASLNLFLGGLAGGALGYVFQILMGRFLGTHEYGTFNAMMGFFSILGAPLGTLSMVVSKSVSTYKAMNDIEGASQFYRWIIKRLLLCSIFIGLIWVVGTNPLMGYLRAENHVQIYLLGFLLILTLFQTLNIATLQGLQKFSWLAMVGGLGVLLKIIFSSGFVWAGLAVTGVLAGSALASLFLCAITIIPLSILRIQKSPVTPPPISLDFKPIFPVFLAQLSFALMTQTDILLVNYYFSSHDAGLYSVACVLGKAVMYLPSGIALALFPIVAEMKAKGEDTSPLLLQSFALVLSLSGAGALFYYFFGSNLVDFLYGSRYLGAGEILRVYGFAILPVTLVMILKHYLLALGSSNFAYFFLPISIMQVVLICFFHSSIIQVLTIMGSAGVLLIVIGILPTHRLLFNRK